MTKDRLNALKAADSSREYVTVPVDDKYGHMDPFFKDVQQISENIEKMQEIVEKVENIYDTMLNTFQSNQNKEKKQLERLMNEFKQTAICARNSLKLTETGIKTLEKEADMSAELRIRRIQYGLLSEKFVNAMNDYTSVQNSYKERCKDRIRRQIEITGNTATDSELEQLLERDNPAVFVQQIITDTQIAKQILDDIETRHNDIIMIEASIRELRELFMDIALLVENQGEMVNQIEFNVTKTIDWVDNGTNHLNSARKNQTKSRKKWFIIIIVIALILLIIVIYLIISFK